MAVPSHKGSELSWRLARELGSQLPTGEVVQEEKEVLVLCQCCCCITMLVAPFSSCALWSLPMLLLRPRELGCLAHCDFTTGQSAHLFIPTSVNENCFQREKCPAQLPGEAISCLSLGLFLWLLHFDPTT